MDDYEAEDDVPLRPPSRGGPDGNPDWDDDGVDEEEYFARDDSDDVSQADARILAAEAPINIVCAMYRLHSSADATIFMPDLLPHSSLKDVLAQSAFVTAIGPRVQDVPMGVINRDRILDIASKFTLTTLRKFITFDRPRQIADIDPAGLLLLSTQLAGTVSTRLEGDATVVSKITPGWPDLHFTTRGNIPVAVEGGEAFLNMWGAAYSANYRLLVPTDAQRSVATLLACHRKVKVTKEGKLVFSDTPPPAPFHINKKQVENDKNRVVQIVDYIRRVSAISKLVIPGQGSRNKVKYFTFFLHLNDKYLGNMVRAEAAKIGDRTHVAAASAAPLMIDRDGPRALFPGIAEPNKMGEFYANRAKHNVHRVGYPNDVKNGDMVAGLGAGGSATSVPHKFHMCLSTLGAVLKDHGIGNGNIPFDAHVFGTGKEALFLGPIRAACDNIQMYEHDQSLCGKQPYGLVEYGDILSMGPDSGTGKALIDDSMPEVGGKISPPGANPPPVFNTHAKLPRIASAKYSCGVVKLMLGDNSDLNSDRFELPDTFAMFLDAYEYVDVVKTNPHSMEYFVLFAKLPPGAPRCGRAQARTTTGALPPIANLTIDLQAKGLWQRRAYFARVAYEANIVKSCAAETCAWAGAELGPIVTGLAPLVRSFPVYHRANVAAPLLERHVRGSVPSPGAGDDTDGLN